VSAYPVVLGMHDTVVTIHREFGPPETRVIQSAAKNFARLGELTGGMAFAPPEIALDVVRDTLRALALAVRTQ